MERVYFLGMKRGLTLAAIGLIVILLLGRAATLAVDHMPRQERVYTVAQVFTGLFWHPNAWVGRTVLVRGTVAQSPWNRDRWGAWIDLCAMPPARCQVKVAAGTAFHVIIQPENYLTFVGSFPSLQFRVQPTDNALLVVLRHLPWMDRILPAPPLQTIPYGDSQVYRIKLLPRPRIDCASCDDAVLVDPAQ